MSRALGSDGVALPSYYGKDTGCLEATSVLGKQSECLDCPFTVCREDNRRVPIPYHAHIRTIDRDREMRAVEATGKTVTQVALLFGVSYKLAWQVLRRKR